MTASDTARSLPSVFPARSVLESRHVRVIAGVAAGLRTAEIAAGLSYSPRSIEGIIENAARRAGVGNRPELVAFAIREGYVQPVDWRALARLSRRQLEVAKLVAAGMSASHIAVLLKVADRTVLAHTAAARRNAGCGTNSALAALVASREVQTGRELRRAIEQPAGVREFWLGSTKGHADIIRLLAPIATTPERIRGLLALGLSATHIALATKVSPSTVRNWTRGEAVPRAEAATVLDDLRTIARALLEGGLEPERAGAWLTSRDAPTGTRPLDNIAVRPADVFAAAAHQVAPERDARRDFIAGDADASVMRRSYTERRVMELLGRGVSLDHIADALDMPASAIAEIADGVRNKYRRALAPRL
jgi:DNA-binding NarL/FixJ family response regulator